MLLTNNFIKRNYIYHSVYYTYYITNTGKTEKKLSQKLLLSHIFSDFNQWKNQNWRILFLYWGYISTYTIVLLFYILIYYKRKTDTLKMEQIVWYQKVSFSLQGVEIIINIIMHRCQVRMYTLKYVYIVSF